jgi:hypothetical protein
VPKLSPQKKHRDHLPVFFRNSLALALGSYRHDIAYTGALKSLQVLALGSYRHDIAYTGALKSVQALPQGSYRQDIAYTGALKSSSLNQILSMKTGVLSIALTPVFRFKEETVA